MGLLSQYSIPGLTKSVKVGMYKLTFAYLVSPIYIALSRRSFFFYFLFFVFYFVFFAYTKNTRTRISKSVTFLPLDIFKRIFYFCLFICVFVFFLGCVFVLFGAFGAFCACFFVRVKSFRKK